MVPTFTSPDAPDAVAVARTPPRYNHPVERAFADCVRRYGCGRPTPEWLRVAKKWQRRDKTLPEYIPVMAVYRPVPFHEVGERQFAAIADVMEESKLIVEVTPGYTGQSILYWPYYGRDVSELSTVCDTFDSLFNGFECPPQVTPWLQYIRDDRLDDLIAWLESGGKINIENEYAGPPILEAIVHRRTAIADELVRRGAKIDFRTREAAKLYGYVIRSRN